MLWEAHALWLSLARILPGRKIEPRVHKKTPLFMRGFLIG
jgi:hypothetical protein